MTRFSTCFFGLFICLLAAFPASAQSPEILDQLERCRTEFEPNRPACTTAYEKRVDYLIEEGRKEEALNLAVELVALAMDIDNYSERFISLSIATDLLIDLKAAEHAQEAFRTLGEMVSENPDSTIHEWTMERLTYKMSLLSGDPYQAALKAFYEENDYDAADAFEFVLRDCPSSSPLDSKCRELAEMAIISFSRTSNFGAAERWLTRLSFEGSSSPDTLGLLNIAIGIGHQQDGRLDRSIVFLKAGYDIFVRDGAEIRDETSQRLFKVGSEMIGDILASFRPVFAVNAYGRGRFAEAEAYLKDAAANPGRNFRSEDLPLYLLHLARKQEKFDECLRIAANATADMDEEDAADYEPFIVAEKALCLVGSGRSDEALSLITRTSIELRPLSTPTDEQLRGYDPEYILRYALGLTLYQLGMFEKAASALEPLVALNSYREFAGGDSSAQIDIRPSRLELRVAYARALAKSSDKSRAYDAFLHAEKLVGSSIAPDRIAEIEVMRGLAEARIDGWSDWREAYRYFRRGVRLTLAELDRADSFDPVTQRALARQKPVFNGLVRSAWVVSKQQ